MKTWSIGERGCLSGRTAAFASCLLFAGFVRAEAATEAPAAPSETGLTLAWSAPARCPQSAEVLARVEALLGQPASRLPTLKASGTISEREDGRYSLVLETSQGSFGGIRTMEADSCSELSDAGASVLALAIRPQPVQPVALAPSVSETEAPHSADSSPGVSPRDTVDKGEEERARRMRHFEGWLEAALAADVGTLPGLGPGAQFGASAQYRQWRINFAATWLANRHKSMREYPALGGDFQYLSGAAGACYADWQRPVTFGGCLALEIGRLHGNGTGAATLDQASLGWALVRPGLVARFTMSDTVAAEFAASLLVPLQSAVFVIDNRGEVYSPASLGVRFTMGLGWRFW